MRDLAALPDPGTVRILALDEERMKLVPQRLTNAFSTGVKPVYRLRTRLGRTIRATGNHKLRTIDGWRRLDELAVGESLLVPCAELVRPRTPELVGVVEGAPRSRRIPADPSTSDVYWDPIVAIEADGVEEVFDLTVEGLHNFVADDIVVHNSIEQDADIVSFIYRDEYYNQESERPGEADLIIAKHRNGPIGTVPLAFQEQFPKFANLASSAQYSGAPEAESGEAA